MVVGILLHQLHQTITTADRLLRTPIVNAVCHVTMELMRHALLVLTVLRMPKVVPSLSRLPKSPIRECYLSFVKWENLYTCVVSCPYIILHLHMISPCSYLLITVVDGGGLQLPNRLLRSHTRKLSYLSYDGILVHIVLSWSSYNLSVCFLLLSSQWWMVGSNSEANY